MNSQNTASNLTHQLIQGLQVIPNNWALTPVGGDKNAYRNNWNQEAPLSHNQLVEEINQPRAKGYAIRTGKYSNGILAIDVDGLTAESLLQEKSCGNLPETVSYTSGLLGHYQLLFYVPEQYWEVFRTIKLKAGVSDNGKDEHLEFRWNGCASVLPPSVHPITGSYSWVRSPQDIAVAECPIWVIELMLNHNQQTEIQAKSATNKQEAPLLLNSGRPPLEIFLGKADRELIESGINDGGRNDAACKLSLNLIATARRLYELGIDYEGDPRILYDQFCQRCNPPLGSDVRGESDGWWRNADARAKRPSLDDDKIQACYDAWQRRQNPSQVTHSKKPITVQSGSVSADSRHLSAGVLTASSLTDNSIQAIVSTVSAILDKNLLEFEEGFELNQVRIQYGVEGKLFERIVASARVKFDEVYPEDELRLKDLIDWSKTTINWDEVLPAPLARDIKHDAHILNIDPIMLWQPLLAVAASLVGGRIFLDMQSHLVPAICWTVTVAESGQGKTRADSLILAPLRNMQADAVKAYKDAEKEYSRAMREYEKSNDDDALEPSPPIMRKYLFEIATIQAVLKRIAEQGEYGSLWARDEIAGLFNSLGQFSIRNNEAEQLLLKLWDGDAALVDRVLLENSFFSMKTAVSLTGGIQEGVFRNVFKDSNDSNGLQARMLFAVPPRRKPSYVEGSCQLRERLPLLYKWLESLSGGYVKISSPTLAYYKKIVEQIGEQTQQTSHQGIRVWMSKLGAQTLRIALVLHLIECYYSPNSRDISTLQLDTLQRAVAFAEYYRNAFNVMQEKVCDNSEISSILLQIYDKALQKLPDGISVRDVYRPSRSIQARAKAVGRESAGYVEDLFTKMEQLGYGYIVRNKRIVKFIAIAQDNQKNTDPPVDSADSADSKSQSIDL